MLPDPKQTVLVGHTEQMDWPVALLKVPAGHRGQTDWPVALLKVPARQGKHVPLVVNEPNVHAWATAKQELKSPKRLNRLRSAGPGVPVAVHRAGGAEVGHRRRRSEPARRNNTDTSSAATARRSTVQHKKPATWGDNTLINKLLLYSSSRMRAKDT